MIPILAQSQALPDPSHWGSIGWVVVILAGIVVMANQASDFFDRRSGKQNQRDINIIPGLVTKPEFDRLAEENKHEHENIFSKIGGIERGLNGRLEEQIRLLRQERREDMCALYDKMNSVNTKVAALEKSSEIQNQQLTQLGMKLDRIIENKLS